MDNHPLYWIKHQEQPIMILAMAIVFSYWSRAHSLKNRESSSRTPSALAFFPFSVRNWLSIWATPGLSLPCWV